VTRLLVIGDTCIQHQEEHRTDLALVCALAHT